MQIHSAKGQFCYHVIDFLLSSLSEIEGAETFINSSFAFATHEG